MFTFNSIKIYKNFYKFPILIKDRQLNPPYTFLQSVTEILHRHLLLTMPSSSQPLSTIIVRSATEADLPALLSLLLTSFRQFPLFAFLYSPLDTDLSATHDTIFFWRRRLLLGLLDPGVTVLVAEIPIDLTEGRSARPVGEEYEGMDGVEKESWRMLDWVREKGLRQESRVSHGMVVVGFAIWNLRLGHAATEEERVKLAPPVVDWRTALRGI